MSARILILAVVIVLLLAGVGAYAFISGQRTPSNAGSTTSSQGTQTINDPHLMTTGTQVTLQAGGSSFVNPIMQVWYFKYRRALTDNDFQLSYVAIGSGAGITNILDNAFEFAGSDAPVPAADMATVSSSDQGNTLLTIPESLGGVAIFYNVPGIDNASLDLTGPILAGIWNQTITMWNAPQIKALNPNVALPDQAIIPTHRSDGSGTTYAFTTYLSKIDSAWNATYGVGLVANWPTDEPAAAGSGGIAELVGQTPYSIGYVDTYYASNNKIPIAAIQNSAGNFILPASQNIEYAADNFTSQLQQNPTVSITDAPGASSYPISTFTYILIWEHQTSQSQGDAATTFLWYVVNLGQTLSPTLGFAPLPSNIVSIDNGLIKEISYNGQAYIS